MSDVSFHFLLYCPSVRVGPHLLAKDPYMLVLVHIGYPELTSRQITYHQCCTEPEGDYFPSSTLVETNSQNSTDISMYHNGYPVVPGHHNLQVSMSAKRTRADAGLELETAYNMGSYIPNSPPIGRPARVYADGIFDLFHVGHAKMLEQAKLLFPEVTLVVGCCSDELTHKMKGKTVLNEVERYESLRHCRWVDEIVEDAPWVITPEFIEKNQIDFVAHDAAPYGSTDDEDVYKFAKDAGIFVATRRTNGVSTTDLIVRILHDYNDFVSRNLSRGISRDRMNVSYIQEQQLRLKDELKKAETAVTTTVGSIMHYVTSSLGL